MNAAPTVTLAEAARRSPLSVATLRRWLTDGKIPGAKRTNEGAWSIPIPGLVEAGAWPSTTPPEADEPPQADSGTEALAEALAQRDHARAELDTERRLREAAERNADDLRTALRMLDAGPPTTGVCEVGACRPRPGRRSPTRARWSSSSSLGPHRLDDPDGHAGMHHRVGSPIRVPGVCLL